MTDDLTPIRKAVSVPLTPERAFDLFTARFGEWWPIATHSVGQGTATGVVFGNGVGGRIVESLADGTTSQWGTVTRWDPPAGVAFTWHAGTSPTEATSVEVSFTEDGQGQTVVELIHSGWDRRPDGPTVRKGYESGWNPVIQCYVSRAEAPDQPPTQPGSRGIAVAEAVLVGGFLEAHRR